MLPWLPPWSLVQSSKPRHFPLPSNPLEHTLAGDSRQPSLQDLSADAFGILGAPAIASAKGSADSKTSKRQHVEAKISNQRSHRVLTTAKEQDYMLHNTTAQPVVFVIQHHVSNGWNASPAPRGRNLQVRSRSSKSLRALALDLLFRIAVSVSGIVAAPSFLLSVLRRMSMKENGTCRRENRSIPCVVRESGGLRISSDGNVVEAEGIKSCSSVCPLARECRGCSLKAASSALPVA